MNHLTLGILTPTIGTNYLKNNIISVQNQTYKNIKHYIIIDGRKYYNKVMKIIKECSMYFNNIPIIINVLEENTGANGWHGHRIYGAYPYLMNTSFITYLDEDNTFQPSFTKIMINAMIENNNPKDYAYCLRNIMDKNGKIIGKDICESLGHQKNYRNQYFLDTNCYIIKREIAIQISAYWYKDGPQYTQDRIVFNHLFTQYKNYKRVPLYLINYMIGNTNRSPTLNFFKSSNFKLLYNIYLKKGIYLFHLNEQTTNLFLNDKNNNNLNFKKLSFLKKYNLQNGYNNINKIFTGSIVIINIDILKNIPNSILNREDIYIIKYNFENKINFNLYKNFILIKLNKLYIKSK